MNKNLLCLFIALCIFGVKCEQISEQMTETQTNIDRATELLRDLLTDAKNNLTDLENTWQENKSLGQQNIANLQNTLASTKSHCENLESTLAEHSSNLQSTRDYIVFLKKRIADNLSKLDSLNEARCVKNANFVRDIKNLNLALNLIKFLRAQIQAKESFSLLEKKVLMQKINNLFQLYETHDTQGLELLQQYVEDPAYEISQDESVKGRTEEEIGSGHVDNDREKLALKDFPNSERYAWGSYKTQLLEVLENFENVIEDHKKQAQQDEINSVLLLAEFQAQTEEENKNLAHEIVVSEAEEQRLSILVEKYTVDSKQCRDDQGKQEQIIAEAEETLAKDQATYDKKHASVVEEIELLREVLEMYQDKISSSESEFKNRVDEVATGVFEDSYDKREVPEHKLLGNAY